MTRCLALAREGSAMTEPQSRLIRVVPELLDRMGTRTDDGRAITAKWGKPIGYCPDSDESIYEPVFTTLDDGWLDAIERQAADAALAGLAETVAGMGGLKGVQNVQFSALMLSQRAVLDAIATARKETT